MTKPLKLPNPSRQIDKDCYKCKVCGYVFPKKESVVSGWKDHAHGLHVHCPKCGVTVERYLKGGK